MFSGVYFGLLVRFPSVLWVFRSSKVRGAGFRLGLIWSLKRVIFGVFFRLKMFFLLVYGKMSESSAYFRRD